jgi:hypothetical protein
MTGAAAGSTVHGCPVCGVGFSTDRAGGRLHHLADGRHVVVTQLSSTVRELSIPQPTRPPPQPGTALTHRDYVILGTVSVLVGLILLLIAVLPHRGF